MSYAKFMLLFMIGVFVALACLIFWPEHKSIIGGAIFYNLYLLFNRYKDKIMEEPKERKILPDEREIQD